MATTEKPKPYKLGRKNIKPTSTIDSIYAKCMDCCGYNPSEAEKRGYKLSNDDLNEANQERINCVIKTCPLWAFRKGVNPYYDKGSTNADTEFEEEGTSDNSE